MAWRRRIVSALQSARTPSSTRSSSVPSAQGKGSSRRLRLRRPKRDPSPGNGLTRNRSSAHQRIADFAAAQKRTLSDHSQTSSKSLEPPPDRAVAPLAPPPASLCSDADHKQVSDGIVSFVVPPQWCSSHITDCFSLFCGPCVGYVRAVHANAAAEALLETARLQVISEVSAVSSPVFVAEREISVDYVTAAGFGRGYAKFEHGFDKGAVVFAVCGPFDFRDRLAGALDSLRHTARVVGVPRSGNVCSDLITSIPSSHPTESVCRVQ